jgi:hypothetical protein
MIETVSSETYPSSSLLLLTLLPLPMEQNPPRLYSYTYTCPIKDRKGNTGIASGTRMVYEHTGQFPRQETIRHVALSDIREYGYEPLTNTVVLSYPVEVDQSTPIHKEWLQGPHFEIFFSNPTEENDLKKRHVEMKENKRPLKKSRK